MAAAAQDPCPRHPASLAERRAVHLPVAPGESVEERSFPEYAQELQAGALQLPTGGGVEIDLVQATWTEELCD